MAGDPRRQIVRGHRQWIPFWGHVAACSWIWKEWHCIRISFSLWCIHRSNLAIQRPDLFTWTCYQWGERALEETKLCVLQKPSFVASELVLQVPQLGPLTSTLKTAKLPSRHHLHKVSIAEHLCFHTNTSTFHWLSRILLQPAHVTLFFCLQLIWFLSGRQKTWIIKSESWSWYILGQLQYKEETDTFVPIKARYQAYWMP